jgi:hypothetical protein
MSTTTTNYTLTNKIESTAGNIVDTNLLSVANRPANSCTLNLPNYEDVRSTNIKTINEYYEDLLSKYTKSYANYAKNSSSNVSDRTYAETQLKPTTTNLNNQIIKLNQTMIDSINKDNDIIMALKNQLEDKKNIVNDNIVNIDNIKNEINTINNQYNLKTENLNKTQNYNESITIWKWLYIIFNIILVVCILGLIIYLLFSNSSSNTTNNTTNNKSNSNNNRIQSIVNLNPGVTSKKIVV